MPKIILQVEDDLNDVFFFQHAMKKVGATSEVQVACDGQEAIAYLKGIGKFADRLRFPLPALILLDLKLPRVMGLDVLKWIREQPGERRIVVILSASANQSDVATAYRLGANAFLIKPSATSKLEELARTINEFWLIYNNPPPENADGEDADLPWRGANRNELDLLSTVRSNLEMDYLPEKQASSRLSQIMM